MLKYKAEWHKQLREISIRNRQNKSIKQFDFVNTNELVVFIAVGADYESGDERISGGLISIISLCEESHKIFVNTQKKVIAVTQNEDHLIFRYKKFDNTTPIFRFSQLSTQFKNLEKITIHIPELFFQQFETKLTMKDKKWLSGIKKVHLNILNQSNLLMPLPASIKETQKRFPNITITTAHQKYCTAYYRDYYSVPLHKLSVYISPEQYRFRHWASKENIIAVSPDENTHKAEILELVKNRMPDYNLVIIQNLSYTEYKELISRAKFSITFGEGLDGYFIEPIFSGSISFAVYNEQFFTEDFKSTPGLYNSFKEMKKIIVRDMLSFSDQIEYITTQSKQFELCSKHYNYKTYQNNIKIFYEGNYTYK